MKVIAKWATIVGMFKSVRTRMMDENQLCRPNVDAMEAIAEQYKNAHTSTGVIKLSGLDIFQRSSPHPYSSKMPYITDLEGRQQTAKTWIDTTRFTAQQGVCVGRLQSMDPECQAWHVGTDQDARDAAVSSPQLEKTLQPQETDHYKHPTVGANMYNNPDLTTRREVRLQRRKSRMRSTNSNHEMKTTTNFIYQF